MQTQSYTTLSRLENLNPVCFIYYSLSVLFLQRAGGMEKPKCVTTFPLFTLLPPSYLHLPSFMAKGSISTVFVFFCCREMAGNAVPEEWEGALDVSYKLGPGLTNGRSVLVMVSH